MQIAEEFSCEIISVDSMQVYRFMDIGTAKPTAAERSRISHHLIDIIDPDENYTVGTFVRDAEKAIQYIYANINTPLLTGGTGLYFRGLLNGVFDDFTGPEEKSGTAQEKHDVRQNLQTRLEEEGGSRLHKELAELDPESAQRIHPNDIQRILRGLEIFYTTGIPWSKHLANQSEKKSRYRVLKIGLTRPRKELYKRINQRVHHMAKQGLLEEVDIQ